MRQKLGIALLLGFMSWTGLEAAQGLEDPAMPDGCDTPFRERASFIGFYDLSLAHLAVQRTASTPGLSELYAVSELEKATAPYYLQRAVENPIYRLISEQLCAFMKTSEAKALEKERVQISSSTEALGKHLLRLSAKLYTESRKLALDLNKELQKQRLEDAAISKKIHEIRRARDMGRNKVSELIESL